MRLLALTKVKVLRVPAVCAAVLAVVCVVSSAQDDPPYQAGRLSYASGTVSIQTAGSDDWGQAYPNLPLSPGDRIFTDQNGEAEIQVGQTYVRVGPNTDITVVDEDVNLISFGVAQGSVHVHAFGFWQGQSLDVSTPNGDARLGQPGELRADVYPDEGSTVFTSMNGSIVISGAGGFWQQLGNWQSLQLAGTNPVSPQWLQPNQPDALDQFSQQRDAEIVNAASYQYMSPGIEGAADLDANGQWVPDSDYGPIWFPRNVPADWQPYHYGHWINRDPWGWVWVEDESWGYAPFHYGRWVSYRGRWGWVPGPREERPVWSPALVVFAGGVSFGGAGVSAWFPLGPGEPYRPWYRCSPHYIDQVNISNIRASRVIHVQRTYVNIVNVTNITYVNRTIGVTAMRQDDFAAGRSARQSAVSVDRRQFDHVRATDTPAPVTMRSIISRPVGHPVPVRVAQPMFINQQGMQITARPGGRPQAPPVRQIEAVRTPPGRTVAAPPPGARYGNQGNNQRPQAYPGGRPVQPNDGRPGNYQNQQPVNDSHGHQPSNNNDTRQPRAIQPVEPGFRPSGHPLQAPNQDRDGNANQQPRNDQPQQNQRQENGSQQMNRGGQPGVPQSPQRGNNQPSTEYKQDFGQVQPNKHDRTETAPSRPETNTPPQRPNPPQYQPQQRQTQQPNTRQEYGPQQMNKRDAQQPPNKDNGKNNRDNNKDNKKDDKKKHD